MQQIFWAIDDFLDKWLEPLYRILLTISIAWFAYIAATEFKVHFPNATDAQRSYILTVGILGYFIGSCGKK